MELIFGSFMQNLIKFIVFVFVAWAGIVCGKKYKEHKQAGIAETAAKKESK